MLKLRKLRCSFCKKNDTEVAKLVAGPGVQICDECVAVASRLMETPPDERRAPERRSSWDRIWTRMCRLFHGKETHQSGSLASI